MRQIRKDFDLIASFVGEKNRILDVGCDDGALLTYLREKLFVETHGIELSMPGVRKCIEKGHSVIQGDANSDLKFYPDNSFDIVILSKTLQAMQQPDSTLRHIIRIGKKAIVGLSNFGHISVLWNLFAHKRMPVTPALPVSWFETPNIHFCTIRDFVDLCDLLDIEVESHRIITGKGRMLNSQPRSRVAALLGAEAIFLLSNAA